MGLDINGTKFLLYASRRGVSFEKTAMIGRQKLLLNAGDLKQNLRLFGFPVTDDAAERMVTGADKYAEKFLQFLGAGDIVSFDATTYENASVVHDFNQPIPDEFKNRFSTVLDGGTLEHIFNFPAAIKNCMEMVSEGGHFLAITPTNNYLGHGFYQFSPELFFRIFSARNGFELRHLMLFEETPGCPWYDVADPDAVQERVWLRNSQPTILLVVAKKIGTVEIFGTAPQQSDYVAIWNGIEASIANTSEYQFPVLPLRKILKLPLTALRKFGLRMNRMRGMLNRHPEHFKKIDLP